MSKPPVSDSDLISGRDLTLGYGRHVVFEKLSFSIEQGDLVGLVGPNGGGKTTLMRAILGALEPLEGKMVRHRSDIAFGYVPQRRHLDPLWPLTTLDVVAMGTYARAGLWHRLSSEQFDDTFRAMEHVGIRHLAQQRYSDLSGGQKQRALVARALATRPNFLILDEPTQGMDLASSTGILDLVVRLHREGITILLASHRLNTVANYVKRVALVHDGSLQIGARNELLTGENLSALYGIPVEVIHEDGDRLVVIGGSTD